MEKGSNMSFERQELNKLIELFPEAVVNGAIDFDIIKKMVSPFEDTSTVFQLNWKGKQEAIKLALNESQVSFKSNALKSVDFGKTNNLYIEGDNLEALKHLQKTYQKQVKLIYIDPPYNTGKDFLYKDNYHEKIKSYLGDTQFEVSKETNGRYHSSWLNMMYPRLYLARNLMKDEGVIFISIDEHEMTNLKAICDEIFGEANKLAIVTVINNLKGRSDRPHFATCHEYMLVYARNRDLCQLSGFALEDDEMDQDYIYMDEMGHYKLIGLRKTGKNWERHHRPSMYYPVLYKDGIISTVTREEYNAIYSKSLKVIDDEFISKLQQTYESKGYDFFLPHDRHGNKGRWRWGYDTFLKQKEWNVEMNSARTVCSKMRATIEDGSIRMKTAKSIWYKPEYDTGNGNKVIKKLFKRTSDLFDNPKSLVFIKDIIKIATDKDSIVLDFFAGSSTTAHAVMSLNAEDGGGRQFIMVQKKEEIDPLSSAYQAGYQTISELGQERIRRSGQLIKKESKEVDTGFKVFELA